MRGQLWSLCEKHLDRPLQLASDYVLARVYKHCLILLDLEQLLGQKELENEYYQFTEMFNTRARKEDVKKNILDLVRQIHTLKATIMESEQKPDFYENQGFTYSENTFDDLYVKKFEDMLNVSTDQSSDDETEAPLHKDDEIGDQIDSSAQIAGGSSGRDSLFDLNNSKHASG